MNIERKELGKLHEAITIKMDKNDYNEPIEKSLRNLRKNVQIRGFRTGTAPMELISKLYRKSILVEEVDKLIQEKISAYIKDNNIQTLGSPVLTENNLNIIANEDEPQLEVTFEVGIKPEIQLNLSKDDEVTFYKINIDEKRINQYLNYYKRAYGTDEKVELSDENSTLKGVIFSYNDDGSQHIYNKEGIITISDIIDEEQKKSFIEKKVGDQITFMAEKIFPNKKNIASLLLIDENEVQTNLSLTITINQITHFVDAEFNQELWNKIYGENIVTSYEQFIEKIKSEIELENLNDSEYLLQKDVLKTLKEKTIVALPEEFLKKQWKIYSNDQKLTDEEIESKFPEYVDMYREQIIYQYIRETQNIIITNEDMMKGAKKITAIKFRLYGINNLNDDYLNELAPTVLQNEKERDQIMDMMLLEKITNFVKELITIKEQEISSDDLMKIYES